MKVLFVHQGLESYVKTDLEIIRSVHNVRECYMPGIRQQGIKSIYYIIKLFRGLIWCDISFSWFGKLHAFFAVMFSKMLGKKSVVVVSGGEVCRFSHNDGLYQSLCTRPILRLFPKYIARNADMLLPVSNYVYREALDTVNADIKRMKVLHHGFDTRLFMKQINLKKRRMAISVAIINDEALYQKRVKEFLEAGKFLKDISLVLIGPDRDGTGQKLRSVLPKNALMAGGLYGDDLVKYMNEAAVYVQPSSWESFGCAVAEAMLCECVPVVTRIPALEELVGDCGVYLDDPITPQEIAEKVKIALNYNELGKRARKHIISKFPLEKRKQKLLKLLESL